MAKSGGARRWWVRRRVVCAPLVVLLALTLPKLGQGGWSTDTPWYAAIALQAWREAGAGKIGALWDLSAMAPTAAATTGGATASGVAAEGTRYFNKPPLGFVLGGLPLWAAGPTVFGARLGSVIGAVMCVAFTVIVVRAGAGRTVALAAGLVLATTIEFSRHARSFSLDLWMTLFIVAAPWPAVSAVRHGKGPLLALTGVGLGLALLVKPLVALLVLPILGVWLLWIGRWRWIGWVVVAGGVSLLIAAPWHLLMWWEHGNAFIDQYFGREIVIRAAGGTGTDGSSPTGGGATVLNEGSGSWWYYLPLLAESYLPWLVTVLAAVGVFIGARVERSRRENTGEAHRAEVAVWSLSAMPWVKLGIVWTVVWLVALSMFADKRPRYLLVLYPVWAWMSAEFLVVLAPIFVRRLWRGVSRWAAPVAVVAGIALAVLPVRIHRPDSPQWGELFAWMREQKVTEVYQGGFVGQRAARLYLEFGRWPIPTRDDAGLSINPPPKRAMIVYHRRDGLAPGPNETIRFQSGDLQVTRLESEPWMPRQVRDTGE